MTIPIRLVLLAGVLLPAGAAGAQSKAAQVDGLLSSFPKGQTKTVNVLQWGPNQLPEIHQRSEQLPFTEEDILKLVKADFEAEELAQMVEERRCACDASAEGMIRLKKAGVPKKVIQAISLHALKPNRALELLVSLDFTREGNEARRQYLYFFVDDGNRTRVFTVNLDNVLSRENEHETLVDKSDILLERKVRRVQLGGEIPLKKYGEHNLVVAPSGKPGLTHPSQLTDKEWERAQSYSFEYPRASLQSVCHLTAAYKRDPVLEYKWHFEGSHFECEWN